MENDISQTQDEVRGFSKWLHDFSARLHRGPLVLGSCVNRCRVLQEFRTTSAGMEPWSVGILGQLSLPLWSCPSLVPQSTSASWSKKWIRKTSSLQSPPKPSRTKTTMRNTMENHHRKYAHPIRRSNVKCEIQTRLLITRNVDLDSERSCESRSVLPDDVLAKMFLLEFFELFSEMMAITIEHKGSHYTLDDLCIHPVEGGGCQVIIHTPYLAGLKYIEFRLSVCWMRGIIVRRQWRLIHILHRHCKDRFLIPLECLWNRRTW